MAIVDITKPMALDETLQGTNTKMDAIIQKLQGIIDALGLDTSVYKPKGNITCAALVPALLIDDNLGNVYNVTDNGTTTSDFVEGAGKPIHVGDNVAIVDVGTGGQSEYKFDLLAGMVDLTNYVQKSVTPGLLKNDGTVDTKDYAEKVAGATNGNLAGLDGNGNPTDSGWNGAKDTTSISGNPISISGLKSNQLAVNPIITFEPIQAGSGTPSPSNIRAISGYDKIEVLSCGKNIFNGEVIQGRWSHTDGTWVEQATFWATKNPIPVIGGQSNYISNVVYRAYYDKNMTFISGDGTGNAVATTPANAVWMHITQAKADWSSPSTTMVAISNTAIDYVPYHKTTDLSESLGQTVYWGNYNPRTGEFEVTHKCVDMGDLNWSGNTYFGVALSDMKAGTTIIGNTDSICSCFQQASAAAIYENTIDNAFSAGGTYIGSRMLSVRYNAYLNNLAGFKTAVTGQKIVYPLATPFTIQLTPHEISLLKDYAYVSTNGTNIALDYHNGELASLADVSQLGETVNEILNQTSQIKIVNIPYSAFTWDSTQKYFVCTSVLIDITKLLGFMVYATNGMAIMSAYAPYTNRIVVAGFIPKTGGSIDNAYEFVCNVVYKV